MKAAISILLLLSFLATAGTGGRVLIECNEGSQKHLELAFAPCCVADHERLDDFQVGHSTGQALAADCGPCVDKPVAHDALQHAVAAKHSVTPKFLEFGFVTPHVCIGSPDLTTILRCSLCASDPGEASARALLTVLRC